MTNREKKPTRKPAKRPAAAPEVMYVVVDRIGCASMVLHHALPAKEICKSRNNRREIGFPYRVVKYRLDTRR